MDSTINYHHCRTDLHLYNVLYHMYLDPITTCHHCRTDIQLYDVLYHGYMESNCRKGLQLYNVFMPWIYEQYYKLSSL